MLQLVILVPVRLQLLQVVRARIMTTRVRMINLICNLLARKFTIDGDIELLYTNLIYFIGNIPRKFHSDWIKVYLWLAISTCKPSNVICSICIEAVNRKLPLPISSRSIHAKVAFVTNGFSRWSRAVEAFKNHEKSEFHLASSKGLINMKKTCVIQHISDGKKREMNEARLSLDKIFEIILFTAKEGLPFRGTYDKDNSAENSKFM
ncbi:hypothetical protein PGB90_010594 [Kerria lacca]